MNNVDTICRILAILSGCKVRLKIYVLLLKVVFFNPYERNLNKICLQVSHIPFYNKYTLKKMRSYMIITRCLKVDKQPTIVSVGQA